MLIYCYLPKNKLYPGTIQNWKENIRIKYKKRIKDSIKKIGLMNPLSCGNEKDNGTYRVNRGNSCLAAIMEMDINLIPCIVYCKENQKHIPEGEQVERSELQKFHKSKIEQVTRDEPMWFGVYFALKRKREFFRQTNELMY
tara:strand:+ start:300 stop:722 length:423 start_codon:yes stop_codon:yes gene_type:complete